jgi:hypothetical protein
MATSATTTVEFDRELLAQLRKTAPGKSNRELLEDLAVIRLGNEAVARIREAFADVPEEEIEREAIKATREVRHEMGAERATPRAA